MSGGFFRGTSADQDTRFSNKQAKLLKSQKFAPELDQLVDVTKVKMDVIKPWIANRVTELLGFEDEVLINFIFGLLDGKDVNGKEVQIQITGFMEKNTGRFMKELWSLLLSAQKNASGVPQQFLDAKEEEIRKKKVESDRITHEIQKRKEVEQAKSKSMDGELDASKSVDDVSEPVLPNHLMLKAFDAHPKEDRNFGERNGSRDINRHPRTSVSAGQSPSSERSLSKSFSNSRSYSDGRNKSRSISISPESHKRSISPARRYQSPLNCSISPNYKDSPRRSRSPVRRRRSSSDSWHRSPSPRRHRSLSPRRHKAPSPRRRRSPSPRRRRSPSPRRRRSPSPRRRRSPSPIRQRSPMLRRRRSPSPMRYRSPSPVRRRSPSPVRYRSSRFVRRRSPSPIRRRSPSPVGRRSPIPSRRRSSTPSQCKSASPAQLSSPSSPRHRLPLLPRKRSSPRSPKHCRRSLLESPEKRKRSPSPYRSHSPPFQTRRSLSRERVIRSNGVGSRRLQVDYESERNYGKKSPTHQAIHREEYKGQDSMSRQTMSLMSPQQDTRNQGDVRQKKKPVLSPSPERSPSQSEHLLSQKTSPIAARRRPSLSRSPLRRNQDRRTHYEKATTVRQTKDRDAGGSISESDGEEGSHHARGYGSQARRTDSPRRKILDSPYGSRRDIHKENKDYSEYSTERVAERQPVRALGHRPESTEAKKQEERKSEKTSTRTDHHRTPTEYSARTLKEIEYGPGRVDGVRLAVEHATNEQRYMKQLERDSPLKRPSKSRVKEDHKADEKHIQSLKTQDSGLDDNYETKEYLRKPLKRVDQNNCASTLDSVSEENEKNKSENVEKRKHRRVEMHEMTSDEDASHDSHIDERKEAKRRRKEEKRLRKEERRRRRGERRRRREEKRASKLKNRTIDTVTPPSDIEIIRKDADDSDSNVGRKESCPSDAEGTESEQKKLEIELRKKALESLRAKKAINP